MKLLDEQNDDFVSIQLMAKQIGPLIFNLPTDKARKQHAKTYINFFLKAIAHSDNEIRYRAAFNIPCMFYFFGTEIKTQNFHDLFDSEDKLNFCDIYSTLLKDEQ